MLNAGAVFNKNIKGLIFNITFVKEKCVLL